MMRRRSGFRRNSRVREVVIVSRDLGVWGFALLNVAFLAFLATTYVARHW